MEPLIPGKKIAKRIKRSFTARFRVLTSNFEDSTKWNIVSIIDLSSSGVFFKHNEDIPIGSAIELNISLPFVNRPAHCLARVCRVDDDKQFKAGLKKIPVYGIAAPFEIMDEDIKEAIDNFAEKLTLMQK
ncbi:MAG: PilZ domain-containing protein [bacterium]|nr:PilZ domain-containing protein [bacterium]